MYFYCGNGTIKERGKCMATPELQQFLLGRYGWKCLICGSNKLQRYGQLLDASFDISKWSYSDKGVYRCLTCGGAGMTGKTLREL